MALSGNFSDIESLYSAKSFLHSLGSQYYDCRFDNAQFIEGHRSSYLFNSSIQYIDEADAILLVGTNPRWEATVLNAPIRKSYINNNCKIGLIGPKFDLTYKYECLSDNLTYLNEILAGKSHFTDILKNAKKPMIIIGTSAINFEGGKDILRICSEIANKYNIINETFNGLNILQQNISRVGSLDIKFYNNNFDQNWNTSIKKHIDINKPVVFLLDLDDIDLSILGKRLCCLYRSSW